MSKTPKYDEKVKKILDALKPGEKTCALTGEKWNMNEAEIAWYRAFNVPPSPYSLLTRWYLLAGITLGYEWWWNKHAETGKPILTYLHPATGISVLPDAEWHAKDFSEINTSYDVSRSFFDQLLALRKRIPVAATLNVKEPQNSISLISQGDVNSYFNVACRGKNSFYSSDGLDIDSCTEVFAGKHITNSVRVVYAERIYNCRVVTHSYDCSNSAFLFDCRNCEFCFGGTNLRNKKFVFFNEQLNEDEYRARVGQIDLSCRSVFEENLQRFHALMEQQGFWPENFNEKAPGCTGEYLRNCTDCTDSFMCFEGPRNNSWVVWAYGKAEGNYFSIGAIEGSNNLMSPEMFESSGNRYSGNLTRCRGLEYSINCINCEDCFACVGLNRKRFHIFNRQYPEQEYWKTLDELKCVLLEKGEYGQMLPPSFGSSYFFESVAGQSLAATGGDRDRLGFPDFEAESHGAIGELGTAISLKDSSKIPNCSSALNVEEWAGVPLFDSGSGRRFAFLKPELEFYKEHRVAPPTDHFISRVKRLYQTANIFLMEDVACHQCQKPLRVAKNVTFKNRRHLCRSCYLSFLETK